MSWVGKLLESRDDLGGRIEYAPKGFIPEIGLRDALSESARERGEGDGKLPATWPREVRSLGFGDAFSLPKGAFDNRMPRVKSETAAQDSKKFATPRWGDEYRGRVFLGIRAAGEFAKPVAPRRPDGTTIATIETSVYFCPHCYDDEPRELVYSTNSSNHAKHMREKHGTKTAPEKTAFRLDPVEEDDVDLSDDSVKYFRLTSHECENLDCGDYGKKFFDAQQAYKHKTRKGCTMTKSQSWYRAREAVEAPALRRREEDPLAKVFRRIVGPDYVARKLERMKPEPESDDEEWTGGEP
jgi:hypothetical protein